MGGEHPAMQDRAPVTEERLLEMAAEIVRAVAPERVYLFGSHARGDAVDDSDVDLLVVEREPFGKGRSRSQGLSRIRRALSRFRFPKDILLYSADEVDYWKDSRNHVIGECLAEGRLLYGRP
jgi:predicted nucleotidyltransferase